MEECVKWKRGSAASFLIMFSRPSSVVDDAFNGFLQQL